MARQIEQFKVLLLHHPFVNTSMVKVSESTTEKPNSLSHQPFAYVFEIITYYECQTIKEMAWM